MMSIKAQSDALQVAFPQFQAVIDEAMHGVWMGPVRPSTTSYLLRIDYRLPPHLALKAPLRTFYPRVYVLEPTLKPNRKAELGPLPHVWYDKEYEGQPNLCLFHPRKGEWHYDCAIATTTLPDACEWLNSYELWRADGRWYGGGEDHGQNITGNDNNDISKIRRDALSGASKIALAG